MQGSDVHACCQTNMLYLTSPVVIRDPVAGDVIIFHPAAGALEQKQHFWEQDPVFIKRVVAVEGDELEVSHVHLLCCPSSLQLVASKHEIRNPHAVTVD